MKTKSILFLLSAMLSLGNVMIFEGCKPKNKGGETVVKFLTHFNELAQNKQADSLRQQFDIPKWAVGVDRLISVLCGTHGINQDTALFKVTLDVSNYSSAPSGSLLQISLPVNFKHNSIAGTQGTLVLKLKQLTEGQYKIVDLDPSFFREYMAYENTVRKQSIKLTDLFAPETLAAFKTADSLKASYDTIPLFQHKDGKAYFFVVKGKWDYYKAKGETRFKGSSANGLMGLVGPGREEIIPTQYNLIHNIGATFNNLVEVDKDNKHGFYDLSGKNVLAVDYDVIYPLNDDDNMALLLKGDDYYWWKKDMSVSDKDPSVKIAEVLPRIQAYSRSSKLTENVLKDITELNDYNYPQSVYMPPSYMVQWGLIPAIQAFKNPLRKTEAYEDDASLSYEIKYEGAKHDEGGWLSGIFYSIADDYISGRGGLYKHKDVLVVNKNKNKIYGLSILNYLEDEEGIADILDSKCSISSFRMVTDSLYEIKIGSGMSMALHDGTSIDGGPVYHYLIMRNEKLTELPNSRKFGFTKYIKMDDSYLGGCYQTDDYVNQKTITHYTAGVNTEMLKYMKNEIYAEYKLAFKDKTWANIFNIGSDEKYNDKVDDSLTVIDKFNIAFINKKLQVKALPQTDKPKTLAAR